MYMLKLCTHWTYVCKTPCYKLLISREHHSWMDWKTGLAVADTSCSRHS